MTPNELLVSKLNLAELTKENVAEMAYTVKIIRKTLDKLDDEIFDFVKRNEEAGNHCENIMIKKGASRRVVTNVRKIFQSLKDFVSQDEFLSCCTVKLSDLKDKFIETHQGTKKDGEQVFNQMIEDSGGIENKTSSDSIYIVESIVSKKFELLEVQ